MRHTSKLVTASAGLFAAAMTGMMAGCQNHSSTDAGTNATMNSVSADKHACKGMNSCNGKGGCKTGDNGCKAKNSCKGKGGCDTINPK